MAVQMADSHLTYIGSFGGTRYDVYPREGGPQLGWVVKDRFGWTAVPGDGATPGIVRRTRREAATALWGDAASSFQPSTDTTKE